MAEGKEKYALIEKPTHCCPAKQKQIGFPTACHREERSDAAISWYTPGQLTLYQEIAASGCALLAMTAEDWSRYFFINAPYSDLPSPVVGTFRKKAQKRPPLAERPWDSLVNLPDYRKLAKCLMVRTI